MYPQSLQNLIDAFRRLPGVGEKTAERYALSVIDMNEQLYEFMKNTMHTDKMIYAITETQYLSATKAFRERMQNGTLPSPMKIVRYHQVTEEKKEETPADRIINLFGKDQVEIIQE